MQSWKSQRTEGDELGLSRNTTEVLQKLLKFQMYVDQLLQSLLECDKENWYEFGDKMISYMEPADNLVDKCIFSESATFHVSGKVNRHNVSISETGSQRAVVEHQCHCPRATLFCVMRFSKFMNHYRDQDQLEIYVYRRCRQTNYLASLDRLIMWCPSNCYSSNFFSLEQGTWIILRAYAKILDNFWRNSFMCEKHGCTGIIFPIKDLKFTLPFCHSTQKNLKWCNDSWPEHSMMRVGLKCLLVGNVLCYQRSPQWAAATTRKRTWILEDCSVLKTKFYVRVLNRNYTSSKPSTNL
jgi:hypothetical protein